MKQFYTVRELLGITGLPSTERAIQIKAVTNNWTHQIRSGKGGAREYHIGCLPKETQTALRISYGKKAFGTAK